jgi:uncharacterized protein YjdB
MRVIFLAVAGLAIGATACSSSGTSVEVQRKPVAAVSLTLPSPTLEEGLTEQATAMPMDANGAPLPDRLVEWESSNSAIASVNETGMISAVSLGTATIVAKSEGARGQGRLDVIARAPINVASVAVALSAASIVVGQTTNATATLRDAAGNTLTGRAISWSSSNAGIASVNGSGVVTAVSAGTANIAATSEGQNGSAALTVTAPTPARVASVTVSPANAGMTVGQTQQLTATLRDANNNVLTGRAVTWTSSNAAVATTSASGLVTAQGSGSATITATSDGIGGSANITASSSPPAGGPVIFTDDFESGNLNKWDEATDATTAVINNSASAHSGNSFMRMTYGIDGRDGGWMNKFFAQGYTRMYVKMWVRFSSNFAGGTKLVSLRGAPIGQPLLGVGRAGICPNGKDSFSANLVTELTGPDTYPTRMYTYWQDMWADGNGQCWGRYGPTPSTWTSPYITPMPMISKGSWHLVEFAVKMNSSATAADGEQKFWIDGVKYGDWKGIRWGDPAFVNLGVLQINGSGSTTQIQTLDIDDLVLIYDYPTP